MTRINIVRRCHNCGTILQGDDPHAPGYIDANVLANPTARVLFCNKCFDESRYNFVPPTPKVDPEFLSMLSDAEASDALIVLVLDLFSFENSFVPQITEIIEGLDILVVANKRDLLPAWMDDALLREYVAHRCRNARLRVKADDVVLTSLTSLADVSEITERIEEKRKRHDVYVIGASGAGKTQLISSILHSYSNFSGRVISTAYYPGTKIRVMQIPLDTSTFLYDTPGTSLDNTIGAKLGIDANRLVAPQEEVRGKKMIVEAGDSILIGGVVRIELLEGKKQEVTLYFASPVTIFKAKSRGEETFFKRASNGTAIPSSPLLNSPSAFDAFDLGVEETGPRDIGVAGLGWMNFEGNNQTWRVYLPKGVSVYTTRAKVKKA